MKVRFNYGNRDHYVVEGKLLRINRPALTAVIRFDDDGSQGEVPLKEVEFLSKKPCKYCGGKGQAEWRPLL